MENNAKRVWGWLLDMALAAHLNANPDQQVRRMAKRYKKTATRAEARTLKAIYTADQPARVVLAAWSQLGAVRL